MSIHTDMQDEHYGDCYDIHLIQSQYKGGGRWRPPQKRWRGLRPRHLFCGFLCCGFEYHQHTSNHHNTCLACRCDWISCFLPMRLGFMFPRRSGNARLRARGVQGGVASQGTLHLGRRVWGRLRPPEKQGDLGGRHAPQLSARFRFLFPFAGRLSN